MSWVPTDADMLDLAIGMSEVSFARKIPIVQFVGRPPKPKTEAANATDPLLFTTGRPKPENTPLPSGTD